MAKLERDRRRSGCLQRRNSEKAGQPLRISLEVRRKLKEQDAKLACLTHGL